MFYNQKNKKGVKRLGQWTIHTRSSKQDPEKMRKIHNDVDTPAKTGIAENSSPATSTAVRSSMATNVVAGVETAENDI